MKITRTFSLLSVALIFGACYVDVYELGSSSSAYYSEAYSEPHSSSSSVYINKKEQDSLKCPERSYETIKVGSLLWMAQNLNEEPSSGNGHWWCWGDDYCREKPDEICRINQNCLMYGKLYDWEAAKNACPLGWRLPSKDDFENLSASLSGNQFYRDSWWNATLGGFRYEDGRYFKMQEGYWWSSTTSGNSAYYANFLANGTKLDGNYFVKTRGLSVRCVK